MIAVITQAIISAISIPTEANNISVHLANGEVVSITPSEWRKGYKHSDEFSIVYKRNKQFYKIHHKEISHVSYESLDTYDKTADFLSEYAEIHAVDEEIQQYYNTKRHKNSRTSQTFAIGAWTIGLVAIHGFY